MHVKCIHSDSLLECQNFITRGGALTLKIGLDSDEVVHDKVLLPLVFPRSDVADFDLVQFELETEVLSVLRGN